MTTESDKLLSKGTEIIAILSKEGDRGCVLVTAALLEQAIEDHLRARLRESDNKQDELISNSPAAPISTFSSKIDLGHRLGIFDENEKAIYHQLRHLRNLCAHSADEQDFSSILFKQRIENIISKSASLWEIMRTQFGPLLDKAAPPESIKAFVELAGWRRAFTLFFSLIIAHKMTNLHRVTKISVLHSGA